MAHVSVDEHAAAVATLVAPALASITPERIPLLAALGRTLAADVLSPVDLPLFRNSQMDGFAVRVDDLRSTPTTLPIAGVIAASAGSPAPLARGTAVRIMTGAPMPDGADAVVPVEDTRVAGDDVTIGSPRAIGDYVRERGSDLGAGQLLVAAGARLASRHLAACAAAGIADVRVTGLVRVAIITTGAELASPGGPVLPGQVYDANSIALVAAASACGARVTLARRVVDDPAVLLAVLDEAAGIADIIITSGGISKGDFEVVRELLEPRGAIVGHIAMQPGGPQATAMFQKVPVVCFPGNPVSTQLSFEVFVAPLLRHVAGLPPAVREHRVLLDAVTSVPGKRQFLRGRAVTIDQQDAVTLVAGPGSHLVAGLAASDLLVIVPEQRSSLEAGEVVETWAL